MLLTIPADHESVLTLRDALDEDNLMSDVETAMAGGCAQTGLVEADHEVLALVPDHCRHILLLRRNADGVLGILSTPSDEDDADMDPSQYATYDPVRADQRLEIARQLSNWMPDSCIENVGDVVTTLANDAVAIEESRTDVIQSSARLLAPGLDMLRVSAEDLRDEEIARVVRESLERIDAVLTA